MTFSSTPRPQYLRQQQGKSSLGRQGSGNHVRHGDSPREDNFLCSDKVTKNTVAALKKLQATEKTCKRSKSKTGISTTKARYAIFGSKILRGAHGFVQDKLSKTDPRAANTLRRFAQRMEFIVSEYLPTPLLRALCKANTADAWTPVGKCKWMAALASSVNYSAPAHVDDDFMLSAHQLNVDNLPEQLRSEVVQYFCFPEYGFAIALRPGDVILFNPQVLHCLSAKRAPFDSLNVHVTTFYLKTAHVGKNNNDLPLTEEEELYYDMTLET